MAATDSDTQPSGTTPEDDARPACTWDICRSPRTGKCFAWCKCICHEWSAARARDTRRQRAAACQFGHEYVDGDWFASIAPRLGNAPSGGGA